MLLDELKTQGKIGEVS